MEAMKTNERYTYADYESWSDDTPRCELIDGFIYAMAAPTRAHQWILGELSYQIRDYLRGKTCEVYVAPFDVRLNYDEADDTVVQPDLLIVCDMEKLENGKHCLGAPDFVIEILSPSNSRHDTVVKFEKYMQAGVREIWIVDPENKKIFAHRQIDKQYVTVCYNEHYKEAPVMVLDNCNIQLAEVFRY